MSAPHDRELRLLFACRANEFRSALAECYFRAGVRRGGDEDRVSVSSAGIRAVPGSAMLPECGTLVGDATAAAFRSRLLTPGLVAESDIVVAMTMAELSDVLRLWPHALRYTVTLTELARVAARTPMTGDGDPADHLMVLLRGAIRSRGLPVEQSGSDIPDEVPDPAGRNAAVLYRTAALVRTCVDRITGALWAATTTATAGTPEPAGRLS